MSEARAQCAQYVNAVKESLPKFNTIHFVSDSRHADIFPLETDLFYAFKRTAPKLK